MITERQRKQRQSGVGASEVAALLGLDPFKSAADVIAIKRGDVTPSNEPPSEAAEIGAALEDGIARLVARRLDCQIVKPTATYKHSGGILFANLDRQVERAARGMPPVEIKDTGRVEEWKQPGSVPIVEAVPLRVLLQVQTQILCAGATRGVIGVMLNAYGRKTIAVYDVPRIDSICERIVDTVHRIWQHHVVGDEPMPASLGTYSADVLSLIEPTPGVVAKIDPVLVAEWRRADAMAKACEKVADTLRARVETAIGDGEAGVGEFGAVNIKKITAKRFDSKKFEADHPDLYAKYLVESWYRRVTAKLDKDWELNHVAAAIDFAGLPQLPAEPVDATV